MRKFLVWPDGTETELSPLNYDEYVKLGLWGGGKFSSWEQWLRDNKLREISSFEPAALAEAVIVLRALDRPFVFGQDQYDEYDAPPVPVPYSTLEAVLAQYTEIGSKCRAIASKYLRVWRPGGLSGLPDSESSAP